MAKIKKSLYEELIKVKRQKKGIASYLISKGYSVAFANSISKNWKELEVEGVKSTTTKSSKPKTPKKATKSKSKKVNISPAKLVFAPATPPPIPTGATQIKEVLDTALVEPQKELVLNISEGYEVKAEVQVKQLTHPRFFLASLVKILQKVGAKVTFNAGLDLNNANDKLDGFTLAINEVH